MQPAIIGPHDPDADTLPGGQGAAVLPPPTGDGSHAAGEDGSPALPGGDHQPHLGQQEPATGTPVPGPRSRRRVVIAVLAGAVAVLVAVPIIIWVAGGHRDPARNTNAGPGGSGSRDGQLGEGHTRDDLPASPTLASDRLKGTPEATLPSTQPTGRTGPGTEPVVATPGETTAQGRTQPGAPAAPVQTQPGGVTAPIRTQPGAPAPPAPVPAPSTAASPQWPSAGYDVASASGPSPQVRGSVTWFNRSVRVSGTMQSGSACTHTVYTGYGSPAQQLARYQTAVRCGSTAVSETLDASEVRGGIVTVYVDLYVGNTRVGRDICVRSTNRCTSG
ncbi:hypothetical protein FRACA_330008 [Frankia canadensis]|uniref:Uncharacterized protein n=1 Tax=Frankia canadensis TaxID=1836972 RepID=A0A2I2KUR7_9ACTN|nr:hypothetical protein FRACA_330008 [Frankia canadensis]SOU56695.1 hypothetical protein FRACA_330008 [Frankia canadensis]